MSRDQGQRRSIPVGRIPWDDQVVDPRSRKGRRHAHLGLLNLLVAAFACGARTLRRAEDLVRDAKKATRRALRLPNGVSDSSLYRLLAKQTTAGFRETVKAQAESILEKEQAVGLQPLLPRGVASFDGKSLWTSSQAAVPGMDQTPCDAEGTPLWRLGTVRAVLTSSPAAPCLDLEPIGAKEGESPAFRVLFARVVQAFGHLFEIVTGDAGLAARENATVVTEAGKHYLFGLKGNQPKLHEYAQTALAEQQCPPRAVTAERSHGARVTRELWCHSVNGPGQTEIDMPGARQFWCVRQTREEEGRPPSVEWRYFVTSMRVGELSYQQFLALVRLHWRIENAHNWTLDVLLREDDGAPCEASRQAIELAAWLRVLAYNALSAWRARSPLKDRLPISWKRAMETLRDAFLHGVDHSTQGASLPLA